jgi:hypothetical protein
MAIITTTAATETITKSAINIPAAMQVNTVTNTATEFSSEPPPNAHAHIVATI